MVFSPRAIIPYEGDCWSCLTSIGCILRVVDGGFRGEEDDGRWQSLVLTGLLLLTGQNGVLTAKIGPLFATEKWLQKSHSLCRFYKTMEY